MASGTTRDQFFQKELVEHGSQKKQSRCSTSTMQNGAGLVKHGTEPQHAIFRHAYYCQAVASLHFLKIYKHV